MLSELFFMLVIFVRVSITFRDCWWSGCQPYQWTYKGCYPEDKYYSIYSKPCGRGGEMFRCCSKPNYQNDNRNNVIDTKDQTFDPVEIGICSWYGAKYQFPRGQRTASGEIFNRFSLNAAHKTLPFGTSIRVMNMKSNETVDVIINDRGPFLHGRILDLTYAAFGEIEDRDRGLFKCSYVIL